MPPLPPCFANAERRFGPAACGRAGHTAQQKCCKKADAARRIDPQRKRFCFF